MKKLASVSQAMWDKCDKALFVTTINDYDYTYAYDSI